MELAQFSIIVFMLMTFFSIACITDCTWVLVFGIVFLICLSVVMFIRGDFDKDFTISAILILVVILVSIFVFIWIYDEWDALYLNLCLITDIT